VLGRLARPTAFAATAAGGLTVVAGLALGMMLIVTVMVLDTTLG